MLPALEFQPIFKRLRWGGERLGTLLKKPIGPHRDYAESWEIADHGEDQSIVVDGPFAGWTLHQLVRAQSAPLLGRHAGAARFPLLVKYLDAHDRLSVQVHPNDVQAARFGLNERGKTEAWVILQADPGSRLYVGLNRGVDRRGLEDAVARGTVEECLHSIPVAAGDCVHVPAGTVHAIGEGIVLAEIQQSSDLTFRLYDWGRVGSDGRPRPLHIAEALACTDFARGPVDAVTPKVVESPGASLRSSPGHPVPDGGRVEELVRNRYFELRRHVSAAAIAIPREDRFRVLMLLGGDAELACGTRRRDFSFGTTLLLPASAAETHAVPKAGCGEITLLEAYVP